MADTSGPEFTFHGTIAVIGKVNFLEILLIQTFHTLFINLPVTPQSKKLSYGQAMKHLERYLLGTQNKGLILHPKGPTNLQC
jgi:hypothetical protein